MSIKIVNARCEEIIFEDGQCTLGLEKNIEHVLQLIPLNRCADCSHNKMKCACDMVNSCFNTFKYFNDTDSASICSVTVRNDDASTLFSCQASQACFLSVCHCLFNSDCSQFASYRHLYRMYHPLFTPYHLIHMYSTSVLLNLIASGEPVRLDTLKAEVLAVTDQMKARLKLIHSNARKFFAGEALDNVFQMLFSASYLSNRMIDKVVGDIAGNPGGRKTAAT